MLRLRKLLVGVPTACALVLLTSAFTAEAPEPSPAPAPAQLEPALRAQSLVHPRLFGPVEAGPRPRLTEPALASSLSREGARRAREAYEAGRLTEALSLLGDGVTPAERFFRGWLLLKAGRPAEAGPLFLALSTDYPALADRCRFLAGTALERSGELAAAAGAFDAVEESSVLHTEAQFALAGVLRRSGDHRGAAAVLAPFAARPAPPWGWDVGGDALFEVAQAQEAAGLGRAAAASYQRVFAEHGASRRSQRARERAEALGSTPTPEQLIQHAEGKMDAHHNQAAVDLVAPLVEAPPAKLAPAWRCRARFVLGKSLRKLRQHAKAVEALEVAVRECEGEPGLWGKALFVAGTSATFTRSEAAVRYYRTLVLEQPESPLADDALFSLAELLERQGRRPQARIALTRLVKLYPSGDTRAEALFRLFWLDRAEGRPDRGLRFLERLERDYAASDPGSVERAAYWRGQTLYAGRQVSAALEAWERLVRAHPASFYAMLALDRLREFSPGRAEALARSLVAAEPTLGLDAPLGVLEGDAHLAAAVELFRLGLPELAKDELLAIDRARLRAAPTPDGIRLLVTLLGRTGEVRLAHAIARNELRNDLSAPVSAETAQVWRVAYPLAFREAIEAHSPDAGVDPDLVQALIREESALDPKVRSWAGAVGLCQLMMPTAREVAGWLKLGGPVTVERLHDPDFNVQLGATYLGRLVKQFKGNLALSLASYNAGAGAVGRWVQRGPKELDEFVEEIPIEETRNYVKRVLKSYAAYRYLYGRAAAGAGVLVAARPPSGG